MEKSQNLQVLIEKKWQDILTNNSAAKLIESNEFDFRFYQIYLIETFHYTSHNARNQALVGARVDNKNVHYMKFCFKHALEEAGHELMAFHDLKQTGVNLTIENLPTPLPETQTLIAYLYHISTTGNPLSRLGYSSWAENSYQYFMPFLMKIQKKLNLSKAQMTFFIEHGEIDESHAEHVLGTIRAQAKTEADIQAIEDAAMTSLDLASRILDGVTREYKQLITDPNNSRYSFLNK